MNTERRCLVLMPFADEFREVYDQVFRPVCSDLGVHCWRVDEIARPGSITKDIIDGIIGSDIIIADLTRRNPNVFYELGIAHSVGNKTIMVSQNSDDIPFDIAAYRVIMYKQTIAGAKTFAERLTKAISELLQRVDRPNNPVQEVLGSRAVGPTRHRQPLVEVFELSSLNKSLRDMITGERIQYADELANLDLEQIRKEYGLGRDNLATLVRMVLNSGAVDDLHAIQEFVVKHRLKLNRRMINDPLMP